MPKSSILDFSSVHRQDLASEVHALRDELAQLQGELAAARASEARLRDGGRSHAGRIAHDLSNVLTPMLMSIALLEEQHADANARGLLGVLKDSALRSVDMLRQIQTLSRGVQQLPAIDVRRLLEDVRRVLAEAFPRAIEVVIEIASEVPEIDGDAAQTYEAIVNLCRDARDAMTAGGCLTLRAEAAVINTKTFVAVTVGNSASGTSAQVLLPARMSAALPHSDDDDPALPRGHGELIFVVDDETSVRTITGQVLSVFGYRVVSAATGAEAVAEFARHQGQIDVVIADWTMPVTNGACTMQALRTIDPEVKLIAVTAADSNAATVDSGQPVAGLLPKPFRTETLLRVLRQALDT
jgi:two-component system, cell cycle sensor histidine kinase and response regulator CckA